MTAYDVGRLAGRADALVDSHGRVLLGIAGPPGAGKSTLADALAQTVRADAVVVSLDGFHLDDAELDRLGRRARKGAPDTFDARGFVHLLGRIRAGTDPVVYAPVFDRPHERAVAGAVAVPATVPLVVVEGNYLLCDDEFATVRTLLDECWWLDVADDERRRRLIDRHVRFGRSPQQAEAWVWQTDEPNAQLVAATRDRAQLIVAAA